MCMFWGVNQGWGIPFGMLLFPIFFFICLGFIFYFFKRKSMVYSSGQTYDYVTNQELLEEVQKLRQEIANLKK